MFFEITGWDGPFLILCSVLQIGRPGEFLGGVDDFVFDVVPGVVTRFGSTPGGVIGVSAGGGELELLGVKVREVVVLTVSSSPGCPFASVSVTVSFFVPNTPPRTPPTIAPTSNNVIKNRNHRIGIPQTCLSLNRLSSVATT